MGTVNEVLRDRAIQHALKLQRYGAGLSQRIIALLNSADEDILAKIAARVAAIEERGFDVGPKTTKRLNQLLAEVQSLNAAICGDLGTALASELVEFSAGEAAYQAQSLAAALPIDVTPTLPPPALLRAIVEETPIDGYLLASHLKGLETGRINRIGQAIRLGLVQGENTDKIVARIRGTKAARYTDGILEISRRSAANIVLTSTSHVSNVAAQATWKENANVVKAWQFLSTLDGRTTITCAALSGQSFPIGEGPIPPRHIRCRSLSVPVTKSFRELGLDKDEHSPGTRASMDGQVAGDTTFKNWLNDKGPTMQDKVLGKTRADLFRSGKLDLQDFIKSDGTVLTLEQLTASYPGIIS
jgi:SPP1 gp7 family putative phage head morphogenesis protein